MTIIEHLSELRRRLILIILVFVISLGAGFFVAPKILELIKEQNSTIQITWNVFSFTDGFTIYLKCALIFSILVTLPVFLYETWVFIKPGLTKEEAGTALWYIPLSFFMFLIGICFSYFVVFPLIVRFMSSINQTIGAVETYGIARYFTFLFNIVLPIGLVFELPVIVLFLTRLGILHPSQLRKMRRVSYLALVILGAVITPPDFASEIMVTIPLILLFELSIWLSAWTAKKSLENGRGTHG